MGKRSAAALLLAWLLATLGACAAQPLTVEEVSDRIRSGLAPGDSMQRVETVLAENGVSYVYNPISNRYEGTVREARRYTKQWGLRTKCQISVIVILDAKYGFAELEVEEVIAGQ